MKKPDAAKRPLKNTGAETAAASLSIFLIYVCFMIASNPSQIVLRQCDVTLTVPPPPGVSEPETVSFGLVKEVKFTLSPITVGRDSKGRTQVAGYDGKITFKMMQTDNEVIAITSALEGSGMLLLSAGEHSIGLPDVQPVCEYDIDGAGGESAITVTADTILDRAQVLDLLEASASAYGGYSGY